jgi:hypothetical protein
VRRAVYDMVDYFGWGGTGCVKEVDMKRGYVIIVGGWVLSMCELFKWDWNELVEWVMWLGGVR